MTTARGGAGIGFESYKDENEIPSREKSFRHFVTFAVVSAFVLASTPARGTGAPPWLLLETLNRLIGRDLEISCFEKAIHLATEFRVASLHSIFTDFLRLRVPF